MEIFSCEVTLSIASVKPCLVNNLPFYESVFFTAGLPYLPYPHFRMQKNLPDTQPKGYDKREIKF